MTKVLVIYWLFFAACPFCEAFATNLPVSSRGKLKPFVGRKVVSSSASDQSDKLFGGTGTGSDSSTPTQRNMNNIANADDLVDRAREMSDRAKEQLPFTQAELDVIIDSIRNIYPKDGVMDFDALRGLLAEVAHLSHTDWSRTGKNSATLAKILLPDGMSANARQLLARIVQEGNWDGAQKHAADKITDDLPWAVLVTGVNGIRKTTSIYQPWFPALLAEALVAPTGSKPTFDESVLPSGKTGFFRQLGKCSVCVPVRYLLHADPHLTTYAK